MSKINDFLDELGLSDTEAKLYLTLVEAGPLSVRDLASTSEMKRTTVYLYIDQLVDKGLIMRLVKGTQKLIAATDPEESLPLLIKNKIHVAKTLEKDFPNILDLVNTTFPHQKEIGEAEIKFYKGKNGVKKIYQDVLNAKEVRSYVNITEIEENFPENAELFDAAFKRNPKMRMYELVDNSPESIERITKSANTKNYIFKILPKDMRLTAQDILIYDGKVGIINLNENIHGVILHNVDFFNNFKLIFDSFWKIIH